MVSTSFVVFTLSNGIFRLVFLHPGRFLCVCFFIKKTTLSTMHSILVYNIFLIFQYVIPICFFSIFLHIFLSLFVEVPYLSITVSL